MNTQHTPGPWAVQFEGEHSPAASGVYSKGKATGRICTVPPMHEDREANARLIAAAPDLLAALQASCIALQDCERRLKSLEGEINYPKLDYQLAENYDLINKAKGSPA